MYEDGSYYSGDAAITFRRPRLFSLASLARQRWLLVWLAISALNYFGFTRAGHTAPARLIFPVLILVIIEARAWWVRRGGGLPPITVTSEEVSLPASLYSRRLVHIPLEKLRSAVVVGRGWRARLVIDGGWRLFSFPINAFNEPDAAERLHTAVKRHLTARPNGAAAWQVVETRHHIAACICFVWPFATLLVAVMAIAAFVLQVAASDHSDPLNLIRLGASSPLLLGADQWFRLVTANLLHASSVHLVGNLAALIWAGARFERIAGWRNTLIVLLASGIASQIASAGLGEWLGRHLFSVGLSGAVFGLVAALGAINWRMRATLPAGLRLPWAAWIIIGLYGVAASTVVPQVDYLAHAGGALAGLILGAILGMGGDVLALRRPGWVNMLTAAGLAAAWSFAIVIGIDRANSRSAHAADIAILADKLLSHGSHTPALLNGVAWDIAVNAEASPELLKRGEELAARAVAAETRIDPKSLNLADATDTQAVLLYRLGQTRKALWQELSVLSDRQVFSAHFAQFLDQAWRNDGLQLFGDSSIAAPSVTLSQGVIHFSASEAAPAGARVYAVLRRHGVVEGLLFFELPPKFYGSLVLPIPWAFRAPSTVAPPEIWTDPASEIRVALFDRRGCFCKNPSVGPVYMPVTPLGRIPGQKRVAP